MVLWSSPKVQIEIDTDVITRQEISDALFVIPQRQTAMVKWYRVRNKCGLYALYDTLQAHGIAVEPCRSDALAAWDTSHIMRQDGTEEEEAGAMVVTEDITTTTATAVAVAGVETQVVVLDDSLSQLLMEPVAYINHVWMMVKVLCHGSF